MTPKSAREILEKHNNGNMTYETYEEGVLAAMEEYLRQSSCGMKWVKCSERMPERINGEAKQIVLRWEFSDNVQLRVTTAHQFADLVKFTIAFDLSKVSWLDEQKEIFSTNKK